MFVYEFMSGVVETITGGDDEDYDPHTHRKVDKPTTYSETMMHLLKGSVGAGVLAMPAAVYRLGLLGGAVGLLVIGLFATYCLLLLIEVQYQLCKRWRKGYIAYPKSMMLAVRDGPPRFRWAANMLYYFVEIVLILWQLGICVIYFVFIAENIKQVCDFYNYETSLRMHICFVLGPVIVINLVKDLKLMTPLSAVSNILTALGLILVSFYLIEDDLLLDRKKMEFHIRGLPIFIGTALFSLEAVGVVLALEYNMEKPKQFVGAFGLLSIGMLGIIVLYTFVGVFGYVKYGDEIKATITLNLPHEQNHRGSILKLSQRHMCRDSFEYCLAVLRKPNSFEATWLYLLSVNLYITKLKLIQKILTETVATKEVFTKKAQAAKIIFAVAIFLTFPLQNYVAYSMVWKRLQKLFAEDQRIVPDYLLRISLVIFPWLLAISVPHLGPFISLFGAFCLSQLAVIFPGLMDLCLWYPDSYGVGNYKCLRDVLIMAVGVFCLLSGCYTSILDIVNA